MRYKKFIKDLESSKSQLAVLIDPDKFNLSLIKLANENNVSCFLVGGSELKTNNIAVIVDQIKKHTKLPVILFPGNEKQITRKADGMLLLSLLSGRNTEYLIEKHIKAAPVIKKLKIQHLPTAYILINGGKPSTTQRVSKTKPIDPKNIQLIKNTSIAGEQLGFKAIYLEAGSGAKNNVSQTILKTIKKSVNIPVIVGGGIDSEKKARALINAGANMLVVGNALEENPNLIIEISKAFK